MDKIDLKEYQNFKASLSEEDLALLNKGLHFYEIAFENIGGLVMPLILEFTFEDNSKEVIRIPAEVWRLDNYNVSKVFHFEKPVISVALDPFLETADTDLSNNNWPRELEPTRFNLFKEKQSRENPMQRQKRIEQMGE
mgnify:CR=1 FL=1